MVQICNQCPECGHSFSIKTPRDKKPLFDFCHHAFQVCGKDQIKSRNAWNHLTCLFSKAQREIYWSSVNITASSASLPLTGEERAGNVATDRLLRVSAGDDRETLGSVTWKTDVCLALLRFVFFNSHFWCPQKLNKGLKCLCLSLDKRRPAGRNTSTSVLTKPAADSLPIVSCAAGQGWQIHWNEQTNCKFWFFLSDLLPSISNLLNKQSGLEANTHD